MIKSYMKIFTAFLFFFLFTGNYNVYAGTEKDSVNKNEGRIFIINTAITDLNEFRKLVKQSVDLKKYGTVQINIGTLADKSFYEIPKGGNPWNEYASNNAPLYKFFPDAKITPFVPAIRKRSSP